MALDAKSKNRLLLATALCLLDAGLTWIAFDYPSNWDFRSVLALFGMAWLAESDYVPVPQLKLHLSVSFAVFVAGLMILGPVPTAAVAGAAACAEGFRRRFRPINHVYNVAQMYASILMAGMALAWVDVTPSVPESMGEMVIALSTTVVVTFAVNTVLVDAFIATRSPSFWSGFRTTLSIDVRWSLLSYAITGTLGILMYYVYLTPLGLAGIALLLLTMVAVRFTARQNAELREAHVETMRLLSSVLDARDHYTHGHSARVSELARAVAAALGLPEPEQQIIESAGLLHDIGKIAVADDILFKNGALTDEEYARMREHPEKGAQMIRPIGYLRQVQEIVRYHHERYDGRGYPHGLAGSQIPMGARILAVADAWDAMTTERSYRAAYTPDQAVRQLYMGKGTQFDPKVVDVFIQEVLPDRGFRVSIEPGSAVSGARAVEEGTAG